MGLFEGESSGANRGANTCWGVSRGSHVLCTPTSNNPLYTCTHQVTHLLEAAARSRSAAAATAPPPCVCAACGSRSSRYDVAFMRCSRCKAVKYCSKRCQRTHWAVHKTSCAEVCDGLDPGQAPAGPLQY